MSYYTDPFICPHCYKIVTATQMAYVCGECEKEYPIYPWGVSFLQERLNTPEAEQERKVCNLEATEYEGHQKEEKGESFLKLQNRLIRASLRGTSRGPILEAGCGTGLVTEALSRTGRRITAVDFSEDSLQILAQKGLPDTTIVHADIGKLPFRSHLFPAIISPGVIHHIPLFEREMVLRELNRCLIPGGKLVVSVYSREKFRTRGLPEEGAYDSGIPYYSFSQEELADAIQRAGFDNIRVRPFGLSLHLRVRRGGYRLYRTLHPLLNWVEGLAHDSLPPHRPYRSEYWFLVARKQMYRPGKAGKAPEEK